MTNVPSMGRIVDAAMFHTCLLREEPFSNGPLPERQMEAIADSAAKAINAATLLESSQHASPATRAMAVHRALAAMWAAGFKTAAQAMGPTDGDQT